MNPLQTAILRHTTTDGRHHFDWLLAGAAIVQPDARETLCWRCPSLLTAMNVRDHMVVEAISKHRGFYLTLQSARELDGGRGRVEPIARGHWAQEMALEKQAGKYLFVDTDIAMTVFYAETLYGSCPAWVKELANKTIYDLYLLLSPDLPWQPDPVRSSPDSRDQVIEFYQNRLVGQRVVLISGTGQARFDAACIAIDTAKITE